MKISAILPSACALAAMSAKDKQAAISQLVSALGTVRGIEVALALKDLAARERAGPTLVPVGRYHVAIPHACTDACRQLVVAVGSSRQGIVWGPAGRAHLVVLLMAPPPARGLYLRVLSRIARLCEMPGFLETMLQSVSSQELIERLASATPGLTASLPTVPLRSATIGAVCRPGVPSPPQPNRVARQTILISRIPLVFPARTVRLAIGRPGGPYTRGDKLPATTVLPQYSPRSLLLSGHRA